MGSKTGTVAPRKNHEDVDDDVDDDDDDGDNDTTSYDQDDPVATTLMGPVDIKCLSRPTAD